AARDQQKNERDAEIIRLHSEGNSQREIERQLKQAGNYAKVSRKAIKRVLEQVVQNGNGLYKDYIEGCRNAPPPQNTDNPCVDEIPAGECEALGFQPQTVQVRNAAGTILTATILSRPLSPRLDAWQKQRKRHIISDITVMSAGGFHPNDIATELNITPAFVQKVIDQQAF
ncbi:MAG: hypothetical protein MJE68_33410, partial [Proteobacteria bacterium]|nr:hypothetical protein [Pseudomonadota bacterium]